jgi:hypothetical protein
MRRHYRSVPKETRKRRVRDVYIAVMVAAAKGAGLALTADEVAALSMDDAISMRANNGLGADEFPSDGLTAWERIDPYKPRDAYNGSIRGSDSDDHIKSSEPK